MTDRVISNLFGPQQGVQAGSGPQNNYFLSLNDMVQSSLRHAVDELQWLEERFLYPAGFGKAREVLATHRTVFLDAASGSGRIATAKMLLWELGRDSEQLYELHRQDGSGQRLLDTQNIGEGDRAWLNLSDVGGQLWAEVQGEFSSLRHAVQSRDAYLVIVVPSGARGLRPEFAQWRVWLDPPKYPQVLRRYLRVDSLLPSPDHPLKFPDGRWPLRDIANYARLIWEAKEKAAGAGDFVAWCETAYLALSGQQTAVAELVAKAGQGSQRALMLATAMLHDAHASNIVFAANSLLSKVGRRDEERSALEETALGERLEGIKAELDASGVIRFKQIRYDSAVRTYFWTHFPELHTVLTEWVSELVDSKTLTPEERERLVTWFAEQCGGERYVSLWAPLVEQWTGKPTDPRVKAATLVLRSGLDDERNSRAFRRQIYRWSCRDALPDALAQVIVAACHDQMAATHPDEALVRLHHVARRERGTTAREALLALVSGDRRFLRQILRRLTDPEMVRRDLDVDLFLDIANPALLTDPGRRHRALIDDDMVRQQLTDGWGSAFARPSDDTWRSQAEHWLDHAATDLRHQHALLGVLVEASGQRTPVLARLYSMTRSTQPRSVISDVLRLKIDAAQGLRSI